MGINLIQAEGKRCSWVSKRTEGGKRFDVVEVLAPGDAEVLSFRESAALLLLCSCR
jgi:hypothetical protein